METPYRVALDIFEGPLDLLLHLIKKNEVDVYDIPIAGITDQYLQYVTLFRDMNLDVAGEYLVMAATLVHIKSRLLLPPSEEDADDTEDDPRAELVQQLVEYQRYREVALTLGERPLLTRDVFPREALAADATAAAAAGVEEGVRLRDVTLADLLEAFRDVTERSLRQAFHSIVSEEVSISECAELIVRRLRAEGPMRFRDLFGDAPSRGRLIATFLALLELVKRHAVRARQEADYGEIMVFAGDRLEVGAAVAEWGGEHGRET